MNSISHSDSRGSLPPVPEIDLPACEWSLQPQELAAFQPFRGRSIVVRIDGVTQLHDGLRGFIEFALRHEMGLSLEVPPFNSRISGHEIAAFAGSASGLEIGQHGDWPDAGLQRPQSSQAAEDGVLPRIDALRRGKLQIAEQFGLFFAGGYSSAEDHVPPWIAQTWGEMGGKFISFVVNRPRGARLRTVKLSTRFWDLEQNRPRGRQAVAGDLRQSIAQMEYAGLVLHAEQLRSSKTVEALQIFFQSLQTAGLKLVRASVQARFQAETVASSPFRDYRGGVLPNV